MLTKKEIEIYNQIKLLQDIYNNMYNKEDDCLPMYKANDYKYAGFVNSELKELFLEIIDLEDFDDNGE